MQTSNSDSNGMNELGNPTLLDNLISVLCTLSQARDVSSITDIVRHAARRLSGADGATFILRDGGNCYYVDEDAIGPLWKGSKFPLNSCVSGWAMLHKSVVVIEDIFSDDRVPIEAYRPTFVKSMAMVPIRREDPLGAIGAYWATPHRATDSEIRALQALADSTSVAFENVTLYEELRRQLAALQKANQGLSRFAWMTTHDLREPIRTIVNYTEMMADECGDTLGSEQKRQMGATVGAAKRLYELVGSIMTLTGIRPPAKLQNLNLNDIVSEVEDSLHAFLNECGGQIRVGPLPSVRSDGPLVQQLLQNLIANGVKFRKPDTIPCVEISAGVKDQMVVVSVTDNGIGIPEKYHTFVFEHFKRVHPQQAYAGSGLGLTICKQIAELLGGEIWIEASGSEGTTVSFSLPIAR